ncbi:2-methylisoborneol synthase, partial [Streptomyces sp. NPDC029216]
MPDPGPSPLQQGPPAAAARFGAPALADALAPVHVPADGAGAATGLRRALPSRPVRPFGTAPAAQAAPAPVTVPEAAGPA